MCCPCRPSSPARATRSRKSPLTTPPAPGGCSHPPRTASPTQEQSSPSLRPEFLGLQLPAHSVETHITGFGVRATLPLIPARTHTDIAFFAVLACQHLRLPDSLLCLYLGRSINAGTSPLHRIGAFTPTFPHNMCPSGNAQEASERQLRRSRGGFLCHLLPPVIRESVTMRTIYLVHNSRQPSHRPHPHGRAYERAVHMYVAAT